MSLTAPNIINKNCLNNDDDNHVEDYFENLKYFFTFCYFTELYSSGKIRLYERLVINSVLCLGSNAPLQWWNKSLGAWGQSQVYEEGDTPLKHNSRTT